MIQLLIVKAQAFCFYSFYKLSGRKLPAAPFKLIKVEVMFDGFIAEAPEWHFLDVVWIVLTVGLRRLPEYHPVFVNAHDFADYVVYSSGSYFGAIGVVRISMDKPLQDVAVCFLVHFAFVVMEAPVFEANRFFWYEAVWQTFEPERRRLMPKAGMQDYR